MRIVFFSTNSNNFDGEKFLIDSIPSNKDFFDLLKKEFPGEKFIVATMLPGKFLTDYNKNEIAEKSDDVEYHLIPDADPQKAADFIKELNPDIAVAATFWVTPFDWLGLNDAMISEILQKSGIKTICHSSYTMSMCFDKYSTHSFLQNHNFNVAKALLIMRELFFAERSHREVKNNFYKNYILDTLKQFSLPVIIKDTVGLSSYGMTVAETFGEVKDYLTSKKNLSDRIAEEYIDGLQFGLEVYGSDGKYFVTDPFIFSKNQYGITSPKQSVKLGPVTDRKFNIDELKKEILRLSNECHFSGCAQIDLVYSGGKWFIIEINPRLSGLTSQTAVSLGETPLSLLTKTALGKLNFSNRFFTLNIKFPLIDKKTREKLSLLPFVKYVSETEDLLARQDREMGYCEVIIADESFSLIQKDLELLEKDFSDIIEKDFVQKAKELIKLI